MAAEKLATSSSACDLFHRPFPSASSIALKAVVYLLLCHFVLVFGDGLDEEQVKLLRFKRQYSYDDGYYGNYYGW
uniref:Uncharacterized protein n=1 Tax=Ditylenchus dipsaci TaxID=166011 RepID=A0A915E799_9BILA